jgi:hypothetical protein
LRQVNDLRIHHTLPANLHRLGAGFSIALAREKPIQRRVAYATGPRVSEPVGGGRDNIGADAPTPATPATIIGCALIGERTQRR